MVAALHAIADHGPGAEFKAAMGAGVREGAEPAGCGAEDDDRLAGQFHADGLLLQLIRLQNRMPMIQHAQG